MSARTDPRAPAADGAALDEVHRTAIPLRTEADLRPLIAAAADCRVVLLGEASHGTAEYHTWRAAITRRLVTEHGFSFVAVEGDWPDCFSINRWIKGDDPGADARTVLRRFHRWPRWMWANEEVADLIDWLRRHNDGTGDGVGFYGLDVYSLWDSLRVVRRYLSDSRPDALDAAEGALRCFDPYGEDPQAYALATRFVPESCEDDVVRLLLATRHDRSAFDGDDPEARLDAEQNAEVVVGAERYYRAMVRADDRSWNVRDCHMVDTLDRLLAHHGPAAKAVVWEHNTHIGDARATPMAEAGLVNVGQVTRQRHAGDGVLAVGFGGYQGSVIAAEAWDAPARRMPVPPARPGSHEDLVHQAAGGPALFVFDQDRDTDWLGRSRDHRAIGVVYRPNEDRSNWVPTVLGRRYDAFCFFDDTEALRPLHPCEPPTVGERETFPTGR